MPLNFTPTTTLNDVMVAYLSVLGAAVADKVKAGTGTRPTVASGVDSDGPFVTLTLSDEENDLTETTSIIIISYPDRVLRAALITGQGDRIKEWKLATAGQAPIQVMAARISAALFV